MGSFLTDFETLKIIQMTAREYLDKIYGTEGIDGSEFTIPIDSAAHYMETYKGKVEKLPMHDVNSRLIDNVTVTNLDLALRMVGITFDKRTIDRIIDLVELIESKGYETSIMDICQLQADWENGC